MHSSLQRTRQNGQNDEYQSRSKPARGMSYQCLRDIKYHFGSSFFGLEMFLLQLDMHTSHASCNVI